MGACCAKKAPSDTKLTDISTVNGETDSKTGNSNNKSKGRYTKDPTSLATPEPQPAAPGKTSFQPIVTTWPFSSPQNNFLSVTEKDERDPNGFSTCIAGLVP